MIVRHLSLRRKLLYSLFGVTGMSFVLVCAMAYKTNGFIDTGRKTAVLAASRSVMDKLDIMLVERANDTSLFAISDVAKSLEPSRLIEFMNELVTVPQSNYEVLLVTDRFGKAIAVNTLGRDGKAAGTSSLLGADLSASKWFVDAINAKPATISDSAAGDRIDRVLGDKRMLTFSAPIRKSATSEIIGVWTSLVGWDVVAEVIDRSKQNFEQDENGTAFLTLLKTDGTVLYSTEAALVDRASHYQKEELARIRSSRIQKTQLSLPNFKGTVFESMTPSRGRSAISELGWITMAQIPSSDSLHRFNLAVAAGSLVLVVIAFFLASVTITRMVRSLQGVIFTLSRESRELKQASSQLTIASQELAGSATEQSSSLQETASSVEQISSMVSRSAENASSSLKMANTSHETASRGQKVIGDLVAAIGQISTSNGSLLAHIEVSNKRFADIISVISEIGDKTKVINDIVFQTKLLSFNASVEAARAGEHGKGFAVVAEEVGNLAQMSGNAAKEISALLASSVETVERIVRETQSQVEHLVSDGKSKIQIGLGVAEQCGRVLEEIVHNEAEVNAMLGEIATASNEQAQGIGEITRAIAQLDQVTNQNARIAQKTAEYASLISKRYQALREQVGSIEAIVRGRRATRAKRMPSSDVVVAHDQRSQPQRTTSNVVSIDRQMRAPTAAFARSEIPSEADPRFREV